MAGTQRLRNSHATVTQRARGSHTKRVLTALNAWFRAFVDLDQYFHVRTPTSPRKTTTSGLILGVSPPAGPGGRPRSPHSPAWGWPGPARQPTRRHVQYLVQGVPAGRRSVHAPGGPLVRGDQVVIPGRGEGRGARTGVIRLVSDICLGVAVRMPGPPRPPVTLTQWITLFPKKPWKYRHDIRHDVG